MRVCFGPDFAGAQAGVGDPADRVMTCSGRSVSCTRATGPYPCVADACPCDQTSPAVVSATVVGAVFNDAIGGWRTHWSDDAKPLIIAAGIPAAHASQAGPDEEIRVEQAGALVPEEDGRPFSSCTPWRM